MFKQLKLLNKKAFRIILIIELFLMVLGIIGLLSPKAVYEYFDYSLNNNQYEFSIGRLPMGSYRVQLQYSTDTDSMYVCTVTDSTMGKDLLRTNGTSLYSGLNATDFELWLLKSSQALTVITSPAASEGGGI